MTIKKDEEKEFQEWKKQKLRKEPERKEESKKEEEMDTHEVRREEIKTQGPPRQGEPGQPGQPGHFAAGDYRGGQGGLGGQGGAGTPGGAGGVGGVGGGGGTGGAEGQTPGGVRAYEGIGFPEIRPAKAGTARVFEKQFIILIAIVGIGTAVFAFNPYLILQGQDQIKDLTIQINDQQKIVKTLATEATKQNAAQQNGIIKLIENQNNNSLTVRNFIAEQRDKQNITGTKIIGQLLYLINRGLNNTNRISNITDSISLVEHNIIGNLTDHRSVANLTRDQDQAMLREILNTLHNKTH